MRTRRWVVVATVSLTLALGLFGYYLLQRRQVERLILAKVSTGMEATAVRQALGPPAQIELKGHFVIGGESGSCGETKATERWVYSKSSFHRLVYFDAAGRVVCDEWFVIHV